MNGSVLTDMNVSAGLVNETGIDCLTVLYAYQPGSATH